MIARGIAGYDGVLYIFYMVIPWRSSKVFASSTLNELNAIIYFDGLRIMFCKPSQVNTPTNVGVFTW